MPDLLGDVVSPIQPNEIVRIVQVEPVGDSAITVYYKDNQGRLGEQMLFRSDQISAVYEATLRRQPLRFVLADDPGAGKTIMAGLLIRELLMRADAKRILIVSPGGLTEQWQDELLE